MVRTSTVPISAETIGEGRSYNLSQLALTLSLMKTDCVIISHKAPVVHYDIIIVIIVMLGFISTNMKAICSLYSKVFFLNRLKIVSYSI